MRAIFQAVALAALALAPVSVGQAQQSSTVRFAKGNYGTHLSGTISGSEYADYKISAKRGQKMFVDLTVSGSNGSGSVFFNILKPGKSGAAIYNSSINGNTTTTTLPVNGVYTIRVYLMGNDRSAGKTAGYELDLSIQ